MRELGMRLGRLVRWLRGWLRPPLTAHLGPVAIALKQGGSTWQGPIAAGSAASPSEQSAAVLAAFREMLAATAVAPGRVNVVVADRWLRPLVLALPAARLSDGEIDAIVAYRYRQIYSGQMQGWVWRHTLQQDGPLLAMAWPELLLSGLRGAIADWGGTLASALPESVRAVQCAAVGPNTWVVVAQAQDATLVRIDKGVWRQWRCQALGAAPAAERVGELLLRTATRLGDGCRDLAIIESEACGPWPREMAKRLEAEGWATQSLAAGAAAGRSAPHLEFAHAPGRAARIRHRLFAGAALLVGIELGALAWSYQSMETERAQLEDDRGRLLKRLRPAGEPPLTKEMSARVEALQNMVASLSVPWERLLGTLESVKGEKIIVESLHPDVAARKVEITATVPSFGEIAAFIDRLNASQVLHDAHLVSEGTGREPGLRFVATARWREAE